MLTPEELQKQRREKAEEVRKTLLCFYWKPYKWQQNKLLDKFGKYNTTVVTASNKIGKCLTFNTLIDTPNGEISIGELYKKGKPFDVYAWNGKRKITAKAKAPFKKEGLHNCYRITMSDNRWIEAADNHRILMQTGHWSFVSDLMKPFGKSQFSSAFVPQLEHIYSDRNASFGCRQASSSVFCQPIHALDEKHLTERQLDCRGNYLKGCRQYGEQFLMDLNSVQVSSPLQADVLQHNGLLFCGDGQGNKYTYNLLRCVARLSSLYALRHFWGRLVEFLYEVFYTISQWSLHGFLISPQPFYAGVSDFQSIPLIEFQAKDISLQTYSPPLYVDSNKIVSYDFIGSQEVYDFEVEEYHNYFAGGLIHHNSCIGANIVISWALGYEPWHRVTADYPDAVKMEDYYFAPSSLGIKPPVDIVIVGEDWKMHIGRTIVRELKKWAPVGFYETKKNEQGVEFQWTWKNKSTFNIMCYTQDDDVFESFRCAGAWLDEPPPKSKYDAMSRGLMLDNGKTLLTLTPLKEAWILDELVLSKRKDILVVDGLCVTDNEDLFKSDCNVLTSMGLSDVQVNDFFDLLLYDDVKTKMPVSNKGKKAEKYLDSIVPVDKQDSIQKLAILKFIKDIDPSEVPSRVFGQFKSLVGKVLKEFDINKHVVKPFEIPVDYPVVPMIDFHLSTPQALSYWTISPYNIYYCIDEVWANISAEEIAEHIIRKKKEKLWNINEVFIDPLSKGDTSYIKNRFGSDVKDSFSIIEDKLAGHGMTLVVASKDKDSGIKNIQNRLSGCNGISTMYFFDKCERHIFEIQRWVFDEWGKPTKDCADHFMENMYRFTLTGIKYDDWKVSPRRDAPETSHWLSM